MSQGKSQEEIAAAVHAAALSAWQEENRLRNLKFGGRANRRAFLRKLKKAKKVKAP